MTSKTNALVGATHLTDEDFVSTIVAAKRPVLVDFYADWCGPCQMAAPIIDKLADEMSEDILITKLDVDANNATASTYGVMSIPTVLVLEANDKGEIHEIKRQVGFAGEQGYRNLIAQVIKKK